MFKLILKKYIQECHSINSGKIIFDLLNEQLLTKKCEVSFEGFDSCTNTFIVVAFINLLKHHSFLHIKNNLLFINTNSNINYLIKHRFEQEFKNC